MATDWCREGKVIYHKLFSFQRQGSRFFTDEAAKPANRLLIINKINRNNRPGLVVYPSPLRGDLKILGVRSQKGLCH